MAMTQTNGMAPVVLKVETDIVASKSGELRDKLRQLVADGARSVTLDFAAVRMVDSAGLGMLIAAHNSLKKVEGELTVTRCSADILELFRSMRIHQHMKIEGQGATAA
jgi:anti-anti-sigma factor